MVSEIFGFILPQSKAQIVGAGQTVPQECPSLDGAATRSSSVNDGSIKSRPIIIARSEGYRASDKVGTFFLESCRAFRNMTIVWLLVHATNTHRCGFCAAELDL